MFLLISIVFGIVATATMAAAHVSPTIGLGSAAICLLAFAAHRLFGRSTPAKEEWRRPTVCVPAGAGMCLLYISGIWNIHRGGGGLQAAVLGLLVTVMVLYKGHRRLFSFR